MSNFNQFLEEHFVKLNEIDGVPINKDNFEIMFEKWKNVISVDDVLELVDIYEKELNN